MRLFTLLLFVVSSAFIFQSSAQQFPCDGKLYFFRNYGGANWLSYIDQYTTATPVVVNVCQIDASISGINAMGANPIDHLIYFTANSNNGTLFQLNSNCTFAGWCLNIPNTDMGCFDNLGRYWIISGTTLEAYDVNSCARVKGPYTIAPLSGSADIAFSVADCHFYMASSSSVIELDTNGVKVNTYATGFGGTGTFGGMAIGSDGNIYGMPDVTATGSLYEFNVTTHTGRLVTTFTNGTANPCGCDMASFPCPTLNSDFTASASSACASSPIQFTNTSQGLVNSFVWDFGDGTKDSTNYNTSHTYASTGTFTVKLAVSAIVKCLYVAPDTFSTTVQIFPSPVAAITGDSAICNGASTTLSASGGASYLWNTGDTVSSITVTPLTTTLYSVTVSDGNGCTAGSSVNVSVNPFLTVTASAQGSTAICQGGSVQICTNGTFNSYIWSAGGQTTQCIEATNPAQYSVTVTDVNGCSGTSNIVSVTAGTPPLLNINADGPTTFCAGDSVTLTASGADSGYVWAPTGETTASIIVKGNGTYSVTGINKNACTALATQAVTVNQLPTVTASAQGNTAICQGGSVQICTNGTFNSYVWNSNGQTTQCIEATNPAQYAVTATDANGCSGTSNIVSVTGGLPPALTINAGGPTTFCAGDSVILTASGADSAYNWNPGGVTGNSIIVKANGTYSVTGTNKDGCSAVSMQAITVNPLPTVTASALGNTAICQGGKVQICTDGTFNSYIWGTNGQTTQCIVATTPAQYSVTATDVNGCSGTSNIIAVTVGVPPALSINAGGPTTFCSGDSVILTASGADSAYVWSPGGATGNSITVNANETYSVTGIDKNGCTAVSMQVVTVEPLPVVSFAPLSNPVCVTDPPFILSGGSPAGGTYSGTGVSGGNTFNPASAGAGTFILTYSFTDAVGCSSSDTMSITVNPGGVVSIASIPELCSIASAYTLSGTPPGGTFSGTGVTGNTFDPSVAGTGTYTITYTNTNSNGCISGSSASTTVTVYNSPVVTISGSQTIRCDLNTIYLGYGPQFVTLTANSGNPVSSYQWYLNGVAIQGATSDSIQVSTAGDYNVIITDVSGCTSDSANTSVFTLNTVDIRCGHDLTKVILCHVPPGNPNNPQTLCIAPEAVPAHLANHPGDCLGPCPGLGHHRMAETETGNADAPALKILPNPFSDITTIAFTLPEDGHAVLHLYDTKGALVSALFDGEVTGGVQYQVTVDGGNLPDGIYISTLTSDSEVMHAKMILAR